MPRERTTEGSLTIFGANPVLELLRSNAPVTRLYVAQGSRGAEIEDAARRRGIAVEGAARDALERRAGSPHHQGAVAVTPPFRYADLGRALEPDCPSALVLDGVQDPRNLGAILRTARAAGAGAVVLPRDRCVAVTPVVVAASAGLVFGLPIVRVPNLVRAMQELKNAGYWLFGLVPREGEPIFQRAPVSRPALVAGGEGEGMRSLVRRTCDFAVSIPMASGVESLNVSVAVGIALYELLLRRGTS
jgi:23S rRNA (guanosine2251-2'-O)-methyltransferase